MPKQNGSGCGRGDCVFRSFLPAGKTEGENRNSYQTIYISYPGLEYNPGQIIEPVQNSWRRRTCMSEQDLYNTKPSTIVMYTASWCPDCKRAKRFFEERGISYLDIDIGKDNEAYRFVEKITRRARVPTIFFPNGAMMVEPSDEALSTKFGEKSWG